MKVLIVESDVDWCQKYFELFAGGNVVIAASTIDQGRAMFEAFRRVEVIIVDGSLDSGWADAEALVRDIHGLNYAGIMVGTSNSTLMRNRLLAAGCDAVCLKHEVEDVVERLQNAEKLADRDFGQPTCT